MRNSAMRQHAVRRQKPVKLLAYALLVPTMVLLAVFTFYPFLRSCYLSLFVTDTLGKPGAYVGLANFKRILTSEAFGNSIIATLKFTVLVGSGTFLLSLIFAFLCLEKTRGSKLYQTMFALPIALASVPVAAISLFILGRNGMLNQLFGTSIAWLSTKSTALTCCAIVTIWSGMGTSFIFLLVGFRNVPDELVESATVDGAGSFRKLLRIYLPIASPQVFFVVFLNILYSFKAFAIIRLLVGSGPADSTNVLVYALYSNAFIRGRFESACVYSLVLCLLIFVVTRIQFICERKIVHYQ